MSKQLYQVWAYLQDMEFCPAVKPPTEYSVQHFKVVRRLDNLFL